MDARLKEAKRTIRQFLHDHYADERLAWLLAHAQSGMLGFSSCCCFIGVVNADHALQPGPGLTILMDAGVNIRHYLRAKLLPGAESAETAFMELGTAPEAYITFPDGADEDDARRRRRLIPILKAEMRRRSRSAAPFALQEVTA
jgi:hypothetical protein